MLQQNDNFDKSTQKSSLGACEAFFTNVHKDSIHFPEKRYDFDVTKTHKTHHLNSEKSPFCSYTSYEGNSKNLKFGDAILKKNAEVPKISKIFAILDPIIFPVMASVAGTIFVAANSVITSSGADVPNATIVKPINTGDKLNFLAIASADSIILSALYKRRDKPINSMQKSINIK